MMRGVRGATTASANDAEAILDATQKLLEEMVSANGIRLEDIAAAFFTVTGDLDAVFPARAARLMGWQHVPLMDAREIPVVGSVPRCIRVLLLWNRDVPQSEVVHVYQGQARGLRPDLAGPVSD
ncbi:MAG: chorismate mutase [Chloroflexi bacterium RBG_13_56_8]|nr:MAG: chorismate mutase [Chloroflexi bacterium RBG_13_56_8]